MSDRQKRIAKQVLWALSWVIAGYIGARLYDQHHKLEEAKILLEQCQQDGRQDCHIEYHDGMYEVLGR